MRTDPNLSQDEVVRHRAGPHRVGATRPRPPWPLTCAGNAFGWLSTGMRARGSGTP